MGCLKLYNNFTDLKVSHVSNCVRLKKSKKNLRRDYRFGFNGQEKVNEIAGVGNHNTALFWEYDTRLGRRWNLDPKVKHFESGYVSLGNSPIIFIDKPGDDSYYFNKEGHLLCFIKTSDDVDIVYRINNNNTIQCLAAYVNDQTKVPDGFGNSCKLSHRATLIEQARSLFSHATRGSFKGTEVTLNGGISGRKAITITTENQAVKETRTTESKCKSDTYLDIPLMAGTLPSPTAMDELDKNAISIPSAEMQIPKNVRFKPNQSQTMEPVYDWQNGRVKRMSVTTYNYTDANGELIPTSSPAYKKETITERKDMTDKDVKAATHE